MLKVSNVDIQIFGIGPVSYWDSKDVDYPEVGDTLTVNGFEVNYDGTTRNIAMRITNADDETDPKIIQLRDPETGQPLWRGPNKKK